MNIKYQISIIGYIFLSFFLSFIHSQTSYTCNVNSPLIPLVEPTPTCTFLSPPATTITCTGIQFCISAFNNITTLNSNDKLKISLLNTKYNSLNNCGLVIDYPAQLFIGSTISLDDGSLVNCGFQSPFITEMRSNVVIYGLGVENCINSSITVPAPTTKGYNPIVLAVTGSFFYNNTGHNGGAIQVSYPNTLSLLNTTFSYNSASNLGGAIYAQTATIFSSNFSYNSAGVSGGAIYSNEAVVRECILQSNSAAQAGGAINTMDMNSYYSTFKNNSAALGGAIYLSSVHGMLNTFSQNTAQQGGAIYLAHSNISNVMQYTTMTKNLAKENGGGIYLLSCLANGGIDFSHSKITLNNASVAGGAVFFDSTPSSYLQHVDLEQNYITGQLANESVPFQEIGCQGTYGNQCNLCSLVENNCTLCTAIGGSCVVQNYTTYCLTSQLCLYGSCAIDINSNYTCDCLSGYYNSQCTGTNTHEESSSSSQAAPEKKSKSKLDKTLEIALPIVFGFLVILFIVTIFIMIRKKRQQPPVGYEPINT